MSKIICDVCGTAFHENATQCPICGCVRPGEVVTTTVASEASEPTTSYTYVKGGRFSKGNVKKRARGMEVRHVQPTADKDEKPNGSNGNKGNKGLIIAVIALLLAIIGVVAYIGIYLLNRDSGNRPDAEQTTLATTGATAETTDPVIPCTAVLPARERITFEKAGAAMLLDVKLTPENTTDALMFESSDETIATVSEDGKITAVGRGEAVVTITCGDATAQCRVTCDIEGTVDQTTAPTTLPEENFELDKSDITMKTKGETARIYSGNIVADQIKWSSDNELVATIKNGVVTAVGSGTTKVHGEYGNTKLSCIIRCSDSVGKAEAQPNDGATESGTYKISATDVTISIGEIFNLTLTDVNGKTIAVTWTVADSSVCSVTGNTVKGLSTSKGGTVVSCTYEGVTYKCIVRVK